MKSFLTSLLLLVFLLPAFTALGQGEGLADRVFSFPYRALNKIRQKAAETEAKLIATTEKALARLEREEERLKRKLAKKDSLAAAQTFGDVKERYAGLRTQLQQGKAKLSGLTSYLPGMDTLKTSLRFLTQQPESLFSGNPASGKLQDAIQSVNGLGDRFSSTASISKYLKDRRALLKLKLQEFGMTKDLLRYNKQAYYYAEQLKAYQALLQDPEKLKQKALQALTRLPAFQQFFAKHSELAQLFSLPGGNGSVASLAGLQTRSQVQGLLQQQLTLAGPNSGQLLQQGIGQAQTQLNQLKDKVNALGGGGSDLDIPSFKPNTQKTKSFWKRLEYGTDLQNTRGNSFLPITTDLGLSIGFRLNDKNAIGLGASYKIGWGQDIRKITLTHEGLGLRSFVDVNLKGSFFITGGYEQNYRQRFENLQQLRGDISNWMQSGLIGLKKKYRINKKFKGNMNLLFDFLYKTHVPQTQPVLFRLGYAF